MGNGRRFASGGVLPGLHRARLDGFGVGESDPMMLGGAFETESPVQRSLMKLKIANEANTVQCSVRDGHKEFASPEVSETKVSNVPTSCKTSAAPTKVHTTRTSKGSRNQNRLELSETDMLQAVASLYADQLKPYGRILRKRLSERGVVVGLASGEAGLGQLRILCANSTWLTIESEQGGEWSALLVDKQPNFVDVYSPIDCYPAEFWMAATVYFESLEGNAMILPGGRFSCAQCLATRKLSFLVNYTLGQVCHIVQLAISQKKLLGYSSDGITPYAHSQSMLKDKAAAKQSACACLGGAGVGELPLATWDSARQYLREALTCSMQEGSESVPLSNIKRIFRSQFRTELSETALGHSKLSELLHDVRLRDVCTVKLLDQGYFVIPQFTLTKDATVHMLPSRVVFCPDEPLCLEDAAPLPESERWFPHSPFAINEDGDAGSMVRNTFIHAGPRPAASRRSKSLPRDFGSEKNRWEATCYSAELTNDPSQHAAGALMSPSPWPQRLGGSMPLLHSFASQQGQCQAHDQPLCCLTNRLMFGTGNPLPFDEFEASQDHLMPASPALTASPCWTPRPNPALIHASRQVVRLSEFI